MILGRVEDFLTGRQIDDTHDERYLQAIARKLVLEKGYNKSQIESRCRLRVEAGEKCGLITIAFMVQIKGRVVILIHYGPGSLVTRHRPALAFGRLVAPYQVPLVVVTNGRQADILDGKTGKIINKGLDEIPARDDLEGQLTDMEFEPIDRERRQREARIVFAYEIDDSCPCDDSSCRL